MTFDPVSFLIHLFISLLLSLTGDPQACQPEIEAQASPQQAQAAATDAGDHQGTKSTSTATRAPQPTQAATSPVVIDEPEVLEPDESFPHCSWKKLPNAEPMWHCVSPDGTHDAFCPREHNDCFANFLKRSQG